MGKVGKRQAFHVRKIGGRDIAGVQQMQLGIALHGKAASLLDDSFVEFVVG
ncbi:hypothetical protein D3C78_1689550 [compost metagenome]